MAKQHKSDDSKLFAFLATFLSIIGFVIALVTKKDDKYVMYYAKQGLVLFIVCVIVGVVNSILMFTIIWVPVAIILNIVLLGLWIVSWVYALSGQMKPIPVIGKYADKIHL